MHNLNTNKKRELINITNLVEETVFESRIKEGIAIVFVPHATAAIIVNEDEQGLKEDILNWLEEVFPRNKDYAHNRIDDNADSHIASAVLSSSKAFPVSKGKLLRGTWQEIFFVELDGPRARRQVIVQVIGE